MSEVSTIVPAPHSQTELGVFAGSILPHLLHLTPWIQLVMAVLSLGLVLYRVTRLLRRKLRK